MLTREEAQKRYSVGDPMLVCDSVADLVETFPVQHQQSVWEFNLTECSTTACIAGWVGILHNDSHNTMWRNNEGSCSYDKREVAWMNRQAERLGLTPMAANTLFNTANEYMAVGMLREMSKHHANSNGELIGDSTLDDMQRKVFARVHGIDHASEIPS